MKRMLNASYGALHGVYWMIYGIFFSFASVFLLGRGYSNSEIGIILALGNIMAIVLQPIFSDIADRSKRISLIQIIISSMIVMFASILSINFTREHSVFFTVSYVIVIGLMMMVQPLVNALSFTLQESGYYINFGLSRGIGSLGYAILCPILGVLVGKYGIKVLPYSGMIVVSLVILVLVIIDKAFKKAKKINKIKKYEGKKYYREDLKEGDITHIRDEGDENLKEKEINWGKFIKRHKVFFIVNLGIFGVFFSNQIVNGFMLQIVTNIQGNSSDMSKIFSAIAFLEIPTLIFFDKLRKKFSCKFMLGLSVISFALQISMYFISKNVFMIYLGVLLQPFSFALMLPSVVHLIDELMDKGESVKGQSVYVMTTIVASIVSAMSGGIIIDFFGVKNLLMISTGLTVLGASTVVFGLKKIENTKA